MFTAPLLIFVRYIKVYLQETSMDTLPKFLKISSTDIFFGAAVKRNIFGTKMIFFNYIQL